MSLNVKEGTCTKLDISGEFDWKYEASYLRISEKECLCIGGRDESKKPSAKIQLLVRKDNKITVTQCNEMNEPRYNAAVCYYHDHIYISGGKDESGKNLKSVEYVLFCGKDK